MLLPRGAASAFTTDIDEIEHLHQSAISRIGNAAAHHLYFSGTAISGIGESNLIRAKDHDNASGAEVIGVNQAVGERFANSFVHGRIINPRYAGELKRHIQRLFQLVVDTEIEIENISRPIAGAGKNPIRPADSRIKLSAVIQKIIGELTDNIIFIAKHQQFGCREMQDIVFIGNSSGADASKKFVVIEPDKWMSVFQ